MDFILNYNSFLVFTNSSKSLKMNNPFAIYVLVSPSYNGFNVADEVSVDDNTSYNSSSLVFYFHEDFSVVKNV